MASLLAVPVALAIAEPAQTVRRGGIDEPGVSAVPRQQESRPGDLRPHAPADLSHPVLRVVAGADAGTVAAANDMFARLLDSVGLYTLMGDLKPMSDIVPRDSRRPYSPAEEATLRPRYAAALAAVESDLIKTRVLWRNLNQGRFGSLFVMRTDLVRHKIIAHQSTFAREKVHPETSTTELLDRLETSRFRDLHRIHGLLYGFPHYAVEFFCRPPVPGAPHGVGKDRQAVRIPSFKPEHYFVYVIPIDDPLSDEDRQVQAKAAAILSEYRTRRPRYQLSGGQLDAIALINDWYRDLASAPRTSTRSSM